MGRVEVGAGAAGHDLEFHFSASTKAALALLPGPDPINAWLVDGQKGRLAS